MEAGYHSQMQRSMTVGGDYGDDGMFNRSSSRAFPMSPTSSYYYDGSPPVTKQQRGAAPQKPIELNSEDSLAKKLTTLTDAFNQGKLVRFEDLMSLRSDNENDPKITQLLNDLHAELRLATTTSKQNVDAAYQSYSPPLEKGEQSFDAHAVYAGDDATSSQGGTRWSQLATTGVRSALMALMSRLGLRPAAEQESPTTSQQQRAAANATGVKQQRSNPYVPSTSSRSTFSNQ